MGSAKIRKEVIYESLENVSSMCSPDTFQLTSERNAWQLNLH
jgi:hypothetical protein